MSRQRMVYEVMMRDAAREIREERTLHELLSSESAWEALPLSDAGMAAALLPRGEES